MAKVGLAECAAVFVGGGAGSVARYVVGVGLGHARPWAARLGGVEAELIPLGTLAVNLTGCLAIGVLWAVLESGGNGAQRGGDGLWRLALMTGVLGGFTTFSAFGLETVRMLSSGARAEALGYVMLSVLGGLALCGVGWWAGSLVTRTALGPGTP
jgi:CrcB protein